MSQRLLRIKKLRRKLAERLLDQYRHGVHGIAMTIGFTDLMLECFFNLSYARAMLREANEIWGVDNYQHCDQLLQQLFELVDTQDNEAVYEILRELNITFGLLSDQPTSTERNPR